MNRRVRRALPAAAAALALLACAGAFAAWWSSAGPGFDREAARLAEVAGVAPGMTVADVGAGSGRMAVAMARRVGPSGRVYATEIDPSLLGRIAARAAAEGAGNVVPVLAGARATALPPGCCAAIYMRRVYHHLADPPAVAAGLHDALLPGGRLAVIDFVTPSWWPFRRHGVTPAAVRAGIEGAGFVFERRIARWSPIDYCLLFRRR